MPRTTRSSATEPGSHSGVTFVFGGTFDPPHLGHREAVRDLAIRLRPEQVLVLPAGSPPLKSTLTEARHRLEMTRLCFDFTGDPALKRRIRVDDREIARSGRSFTYDTLKELQSEYPRLAFVAGTDQLYQMEKWHRFPELLSSADWIFLIRRPEPKTRALAEMDRWTQAGFVRPESDHWVTTGPEARTVQLLETPAREISSSEIRADLASGKPPLTVTPAVAHYIVSQGLYRAPEGASGP